MENTPFAQPASLTKFKTFVKVSITFAFTNLQDLISIHNAENWLGMDDDLGGPMSTSNSVQPSNKSVQEKTSPNVSAGIISNKLRSDTPDSAIGGSDFNQFRAASNSPSSSSPASTASSNGDQGKY